MLKDLLKNKGFQVILIIFTGIILRFFFSTFPANYDFESYKIVISILEKGGNVYAETSRYNYGPLWFGILWFLNLLSQYLSLRLLICSILTIADLGIFYILLKKYGLKVAAIFFLNPLCILITGFHQQFDNFAVFLGLLAMVFYSKGTEFRNKFIGLLFLGLSLITKHLLFFFPFWIFFKEKEIKWKVLSLIIPFGFFLMSFIPFLDKGLSGIIENVFFYRSVNNAPFYYIFVPQFWSQLFPITWVFVLLMIILGYFFRKKNYFELVLFYFLMLLSFSPAVFYNYFSWVLASIAIYWNRWFLTFTLLATFLYLLDGYGLGIALLINNAPPQFLYSYYGSRVFDIPILILICGVIWVFYKKDILKFISKNRLFVWFKNKFLI